ncbi:hypothetical protein I308_105563 [Cryptococcus tetragattii IND107]|uniref:Major facilitator superfamily (MFS) profile domain-containing protein n=1 Tax=Cryptococcus tetragattii IND107 TaxID=1296105 RepID=A0ABR3BLC3_9TREE
MPYLGLRGNSLLFAISATAGMGFCLFGIEDSSLGGVISSDPFQNRFHLDATGQGAVTGCFEIGCFFGGLAFAFLGERYARRIVLFIATVPLLIGTVLQVATYSTGQLAAGRVVAGLGFGAITSALPIWQNETSPAAMRGMLICASLSMLIVGQLIAYWAAYGLLQVYDDDRVYRIVFSLQGMAGIIMAFMLIFMPESPRYLLAHDKQDEARQVISALLDLPEDDPAVIGQIEEITQAIELEMASAKNWRDLFKSAHDAQGEKRRMLTAVVIQVCQPFSGSTIISYYLTTIFQEAVGLTSHTSALLSGYLQVWFLFASFGTWYLIEHAGRRNLFLVTAFFMSAVMFIMGGLLKMDTKSTGIGAAAMIFAYQGFFTWGWMAGVWAYSSEICPLSWRSKGMGLAVALQWLFDFVLLMVTPIGISNIGYGMFMLFGVFNLCFIPIVYFLCPETAGVTLEHIDEFYGPGKNPVKESSRIRKEMKEARKRQEDELERQEVAVSVMWEEKGKVTEVEKV